MEVLGGEAGEEGQASLGEQQRNRFGGGGGPRDGQRPFRAQDIGLTATETETRGQRGGACPDKARVLETRSPRQDAGGNAEGLGLQSWARRNLSMGTFLDSQGQADPGDEGRAQAGPGASAGAHESAASGALSAPRVLHGREGERSGWGSGAPGEPSASVRPGPPRAEPRSAPPETASPGRSRNVPARSRGSESAVAAGESNRDGEGAYPAPTVGREPAAARPRLPGVSLIVSAGSALSRRGLTTVSSSITAAVAEPNLSVQVLVKIYSFY